jgi:tRNA pseudouridine38-40 synthase
MQDAADALVGTHDFSAFRAAECQAALADATLATVSVVAAGEYVRFDFCANAFLHHMIRNIVGALVYVGAGKHPPSWSASSWRARPHARGADVLPGRALFHGRRVPATWPLPATRRAVVVPAP